MSYCFKIAMLCPLHEEQPDEEKCSINLELERRALKAEEEAKQKEEDVMQKEEEIVGLRQQIEHYESRLYELEAKMRPVEEELQKQITALQVSNQKDHNLLRFLAPLRCYNPSTKECLHVASRCLRVPRPRVERVVQRASIAGNYPAAAVSASHGLNNLRPPPQ